VLLAIASGRLQAQLSLQEALRAAFPPPARIERRTAFLSEQDLQAARAQAGPDAPVTQRVVSYYLARLGSRPAGVAYFDSHRVRTLNEVILVVIDSADRIRNIEVLRFAEPPEYMARDSWLRQFEGKPLDEELSLKGSIATMSGATLTSKAIVRASRRVLALHQRVRPFRATAPQP
jgi:Na+-translocating ferredoxin:NAD+ oxidoreductase RnfG subunit